MLPGNTSSGLVLESMILRALTPSDWCHQRLEHEADIAKVQEDLGHANVSTTRLYDRRKSRPEDAATLKISY